MLYREKTKINGVDFIHTYSDLYTIERDGVEYDEAYDPIDRDRTYTETANPKVIYPESSGNL